jgi:uncharacterized protein YdeI (BOF family)
MKKSTMLKFKSGLITLCHSVTGTLLLTSSLILADTNTIPQVSAEALNQNAGKYLGKQVSLNGQIDRVLGNGSYIFKDSDKSKSSTHRVLVLTSTSPMNDQNKKQQAGIAPTKMKEGDSVQLSGKVEEFVASSEVDSFTPKSDTETFSDSSVAIPVVIIQPNGMMKNT